MENQIFFYNHHNNCIMFWPKQFFLKEAEIGDQPHIVMMPKEEKKILTVDILFD